MYTIDRLYKDVYAFATRGASLFHIGRTVLGRKIPCIHLGSELGNQIIIQGAIHAREHISTALIIKQIDYLLSEGVTHGGIYFVPMMNIDGVGICESIDSVNDNAVKDFLLNINGCSNFTLFKANANAVDLNVNFDARFGTGISNIRTPAPENFIGKHPASEPETRALISLTKMVRPGMTISYHAKGREIYWDFGQVGKVKERDFTFAKKLSSLTSYKLVSGAGSAGGYKDYCIEKLGIPSYTLELIDDNFSHPVPYSELDTEFRLNRQVPQACLDFLNG